MQPSTVGAIIHRLRSTKQTGGGDSENPNTSRGPRLKMQGTIIKMITIQLLVLVREAPPGLLYK